MRKGRPGHGHCSDHGILVGQRKSARGCAWLARDRKPLIVNLEV